MARAAPGGAANELAGRPYRLAWPRTLDSQSRNRGSNPRRGASPSSREPDATMVSHAKSCSLPESRQGRQLCAPCGDPPSPPPSVPQERGTLISLGAARPLTLSEMVMPEIGWSTGLRTTPTLTTTGGRTRRRSRAGTIPSTTRATPESEEAAGAGVARSAGGPTSAGGRFRCWPWPRTQRPRPSCTGESGDRCGTAWRSSWWFCRLFQAIWSWCAS